ncbi:MAG TPA: hypothetical protein VFT19_13225, partial [Solirubrobacterales bacterium]|nr:hypothetical protein [Solirubrobacterales bacterium]
LAHRNRAMRHRARALARRGHRAPNPRQSRALRRRAHRLAATSKRRAKAAQRLAQRTKRCRRAG